MAYRPDVDGLRAVAVGMVLLYHAGLGFEGGYVGVDLFFVISGYLITALILKAQDAGDAGAADAGFSLGRFWVRRVRRIVPAATAVTVVTLAAGALILLPGELTDLGLVRPVAAGDGGERLVLPGPPGGVLRDLRGTDLRCCTAGVWRWRSSSTCSSRWPWSGGGRLGLHARFGRGGLAVGRGGRRARRRWRRRSTAVRDRTGGCSPSTCCPAGRGSWASAPCWRSSAGRGPAAPGVRETLSAGGLIGGAGVRVVNTLAGDAVPRAVGGPAVPRGGGD